MTKSLSKKIVLIIFFLFFLFPPKAQAQVPPPVVKCDDTDLPEFHSLRPYQASPCVSEISETATFCGNSLSLGDQITMTYDPSYTGCQSIAGGKRRCTYTIQRSKSISINLSEAELPIMGNTEDVTNYDKEEDDITDADKVNEYVSWYLSGVPFKRETGFPNPLEDISDPALLNYAGPVAKLLPQEIQLAKRIETVEEAVGKDVNQDGTKPEQQRHDQVVVCGRETGIDIFGIGETESIPCEDFGLFTDKYRLSDWTKDLSFLTDAIGHAVDLVGTFAKALPDLPRTAIQEALNTIKPWNKRVPPLSWDFDDPLLYRKAYNEWRGKSCLLVPFPVRFLVCLDTFLVPNKYANLFPYIPLSSTEDRKGETEVDSSGITPTEPDMEVKVLSANFSNATLFFPHMEEAVDLAANLQDTFAFKGAGLTTRGSSASVSTGTTCNVVEVRSNSGDSLFASGISGNLAYEATFSCDFDLGQTSGKRKIGQTPAIEPCEKNVAINLGVKTKTPLADEAWSRLVAGQAGVVRRLFPKLGAGSLLGQIKDIPGVTNVTYSGDAQGTGTLFFSHLGGISEYFLKGIQTLLRPKGYGEPISLAEAGPAGSQCDYGTVDVDDAISQAADKYHVPASLLRAIYEIEGTEHIANPSGYVCQELYQGKFAGVMAIGKESYNLVTCENERLDNDIEVCTPPGSEKLSRCDIYDAFELAARVLLFGAGKWIYGPGNCRATGGLSAKSEIYTAACNYYGSFNPDRLTIAYANAMRVPQSQKRQDGDMNYCDIVCLKMGLCPPYPAR